MCDAAEPYDFARRDLALERSPLVVAPFSVRHDDGLGQRAGRRRDSQQKCTLLHLLTR